MLYTIPEIFRNDITKYVNKMCKKLDSIKVRYSVKYGDTYSKIVWLENDGVSMQVDMDVFDIWYEADDIYKVGNFEILAVLEHAVDAQGNRLNNMVYKIGNERIDEDDYKILVRLDCNCQHCNTKRRRKKTVVLKNIDTNKAIQVGLTCLNNYLGISIADKLDRMTNFQRTLNNKLGSISINNAGMCCNVNSIIIDNIIATALYMQDADPAFSGSSNVAIKNIIEHLNDTCDWVHMLHESNESEKYNAKANEIVTYVGKHELTNNPFINNVITLCKNRVINMDNIKMSIWTLSVYSQLKRQDNREHEEYMRSIETEYYGKVGERLENIWVTVDKLLVFKRLEYGYGINKEHYLWLLSSGKYRFLWSTGTLLEINSRYLIKRANIIGQSEYNKMKQTKITHCKITDSNNDINYKSKK